MTAFLAMWMVDISFGVGLMIFITGLHTLGWLTGVGSSLILSQLLQLGHPHRLREVMMHIGVLLFGFLASFAFVVFLGSQNDHVRESVGRIYVLLTFPIGFAVAFILSGLARRGASQTEQ